MLFKSSRRQFKYSLKFFCIIFLLSRPVVIHAQGLVINEVMSSNTSGIMDEDGDTSDWIELYNSDNSSVNLNGFCLTDNPLSPAKWTFPAIEMPPHSFLLIFASGKDRAVQVNHWETIIDWGDSWKYLPVSSPQAVSWKNVWYNDAGWSTGPTGIGYGDGDDATIIDPTLTLYLRKTFFLADTATVKNIILHIDYDDSFVAYLNGQEIARSNIGQKGQAPAYNQPADSYREALIYQGGLPEKFDASDYKSNLIPGENVLAVEIHNYDSNSSDLTVIPFLTLGMTSAPLNPRGVNDLLSFSGSNLHTNFNLDASGENLLLSDNAGSILDSVFVSAGISNYSFGRMIDAAGSWAFFADPTPAGTNNSSDPGHFAGHVNFSHPGGFYYEPMIITLSGDNPTDSVFYTLDGSLPERNDYFYTSPVTINKTTVIRARTFNGANYPGPVNTQTYFLNENHALPVISLVTDPDNLWDEETGIYVKGPDAETAVPHFGANFWQDWEKPAHIEFFEPDQQPGFASGCGLKIFGGWSRANAQKSLSVFFRGEYGKAELHYPLFPGDDNQEFQSFILRNSGNDWPAAMFRDGLMHSLVENLDVDNQNFRPAVLYINGDYWGIQNIREKISEHYIAKRHNADPANIDLLESNAFPIHGDNQAYNIMINYLQTENLSGLQAWEYIQDNIDVEAYLNYMIAQIYFDNTDWPGNNIKFWRERKDTGKWRWILFDTDFGFALYNNPGYNNNTLAFALQENGPDWPNPPWSTLLLRRLLQNPQFRKEFINRTADLLNSNFKSNIVNAFIDSLSAVISPEINRHLQRWNQDAGFRNSQIQLMKNFAVYRPTYLAGHVLLQFSLPGMGLIRLQADDGGKIRINLLEINSFPWFGHYFKNNLVDIEAIPEPGYIFNGWSGDITSEEKIITINPANEPDITANFSKDTSINDVVINEINYNSADDFDTGDWVEFMNAGDDIVNLSGWIFKDENDDHQFIFPENSFLQPDSFMLLVNNDSAFSSRFPGSYNAFEIDFAFDGAGELLRLFSVSGLITDSLTYNDKAPWPTQADGGGATMELLNPRRDNARGENWQASVGHGSPGRMNSVFTNIDKNDSADIPSLFDLQQNYPNPFNPQTRIAYRLAYNAHVVINVYDINGKKIETLVNASIKAGNHTIKFNANDLASGIYIYSMAVNNNILFSKKMILIR